jgi:hypothetical protein
MKKRIYLNLDKNKGVTKKKNTVEKTKEQDSPLNVKSNKKNEDIYREEYRLDLETKSSKTIKK